MFLYVENLKNMDKNSLAVTSINTNNYVFPQEYFCSKLAKIANKKTKKALLIDLRNMNYVQLTNYLTVQSYQININTTKLLILKW